MRSKDLNFLLLTIAGGIIATLIANAVIQRYPRL
jgi:hypothetical protein